MHCAQGGPSNGVKKGSYLKMDGSFLEDEAFKEKICSKWEQGVRDLSGVDPRIQWDILWKRIEQDFREERNRRRAARERFENDLVALQQLREHVVVNPDLDLILTLTLLEAEIRKRECKDAIAWKRRGRVRWLSMGDAPSHYFFAQVKAK